MKYTFKLIPQGVIPRDPDLTFQVQDLPAVAAETRSVCMLTEKQVGFGSATDELTGSAKLTWDDVSLSLILGEQDTSVMIAGAAAQAASDVAGCGVNFYGGDGDGAGSGGDAYLNGGTGGVTGGGGLAFVSGGPGGSTEGPGGYVFVYGGSATVGDGGAVNISGGGSADGSGGYAALQGGQGAGTGTGGDVTLGAGAAAGTGDGGAAQVYGGYAAGSSGTGGTATVRGGTSLNGAGGDVNIAGGTGATAAGRINLQSPAVLSSYIEGTEQSAPAAPPSNGYRIYAVDNGAGKTKLMVIFASGAAQQLAIQP